MAGHAESAERFVRLLEPVRAALESYCVRHLRDRTAVADVLQTAVGLAYRDFDEFSEGSNFRAWIFRYVRLQIRSRNRDERLRYRDLTSDPEVEARWEPPQGNLLDTLLLNPDAVLEHCDDELAASIVALKEPERSVFLLRAIGDFRYREIADILEIPMGTMMSALSRARSRLREQLAEFGIERGIFDRPKRRDELPGEGES